MTATTRTVTAAILLLLGTFESGAQEQTIRVFSHRGGRMEYDENTMSAFKASYDKGYRGFETDIRLTKDGKLVITHDSTLERTTDGEGSVEEKTEAELRALNTKGGHKLIFLDEFLDFLKGKSGLYVEFELKTVPFKYYPEEKLHELCDKLYAAVEAARTPDVCFLYTSSNYGALRYIQQKYRCNDLLLITSKPCNDETIALCKAMGISRLGAKMGGTSRSAVEKAHKEGLTVSLWPGSSVDDFVLGSYLGADFLCTDVPVAVKEFATTKTPWLNVIY